MKNFYKKTLLDLKKKKNLRPNSNVKIYLQPTGLRENSSLKNILVLHENTMKRNFSKKYQRGTINKQANFETNKIETFAWNQQQGEPSPLPRIPLARNDSTCIDRFLAGECRVNEANRATL